MNTSGLDYTALTIALIGAINWGLIGFFRFDLVAFLCGGLYLLTMYGRIVSGRSAQSI